MEQVHNKSVHIENQNLEQSEHCYQSIWPSWPSIITCDSWLVHSAL